MRTIVKILRLSKKEKREKTLFFHLLYFILLLHCIALETVDSTKFTHEVFVQISLNGNGEFNLCMLAHLGDC